MGWNYHKSIKLGPFRLNLSRHGVGHSFGGRRFHVSRTPDGRKYVSVTLPGGFHLGKTIGGHPRRRRY
ncbi:DUF4236 domain-containing protein [Planomonospora sp. ID91781]|uniref:DUF4236 domain-containing protein n=2 Tax=Planomonospora parontospora TaxID=58119 RepID=A0AA37BHV6_9ACTN|nr:MULTISPECIES: DUF4236 domain-containing protein [Planomonospora]MBG0821492.1 DUF4236 domain-containing protein [Planomonospora sp. ID91781]GGK73004.1 hypothetical protein GCM10010126_35520 [Planomonospora parontospora]GII09345.1 hypothetical protein Ppa06_31430 [Planomonospora parontospora subsp. parontospora]